MKRDALGWLTSRLKGRIVGKGMAPAMDYGSWSGAAGLGPGLFGV